MLSVNEPKIQQTANIRSKERIWELDLIRGFCVLLMIVDHLLFDLGFVFLQQWFPEAEGGPVFALCTFARDIYWTHPLRIAARVFVLSGFIGVCGISCSLSRSNFKRGFKLLLVALALTAATALIDYIAGWGQRYVISFGILHLLAVSILVYAVLQRFGYLPSLLLGAAILILGWFTGSSFSDSPSFFLFALGLSKNGYSADIFPIIPYLGWFLIGAAVGSLLYRQKKSLFPQRGKSSFLRPLYWLGRHALVVYVLHQPLLFGLLWLLGILVQTAPGRLTAP
jgi:uncharacterized membrane protein